MLTNINKTAKKILKWDITEIKELAGYKNYNFLIKTERGKYVFKMYPYDDTTAQFLEAEIEILLRLNLNAETRYPHPIAFPDGTYLKVAEDNGQKYLCRILTFLEGEFLGKVPLSENIMSSLGRFLAETDIKLRNIENNTIKKIVNEWDIQNLHLNEKFFKYITDKFDRKTVEYFYNTFYENAYPHLKKLPKQIIHNDANEWNTLTNNGSISGIIDFGDMVYSQRINEPAIAIAYSCFNTDEPLKWAVYLLKSYHDVSSLNEVEINIIFYLIAARLVMSVSHSAYSKITDPHNSHKFVSEKPAWKFLRILKNIRPGQAAEIFTKALK